MSGNAILSLILAIPLAGFVLGVVFNSMWWLVLLLPLITLMEGGIFLIAVVVVIATMIIG